MPRPASKKSKAVSFPRKLGGKAVAFVGTFGYEDFYRAEMTDLVRAEGGHVVDGVTTAPDYLVVGDGKRGQPPGAAARIQKKWPSAEVIDQAGFYAFVAPTPDELMAFVATGPHPREAWEKIRTTLEKARLSFDLSDRDFRHIDLTGAFLYDVVVDGGDFRGGQLARQGFSNVRGARFDGADMRGCELKNARDCSLKRVNLDDARVDYEFRNCDFTGAILTRVRGWDLRAIDCRFARVKAAGASFDGCEFQGCDFASADLTEAGLEKSDFTGAILAGADLSKVVAAGAKFVNADLRRAKFRNAVLTGADFTNAKIDRADFTGANLSGVIARGVDPSKGKNFTLREAREPGPELEELARIATASKRFRTSIELTLEGGESVVLTPIWYTTATRREPQAEFAHESANCIYQGRLDAPTFLHGFLNLVNRWAHGTPKFDTVQVEAKGCPLRGKDLQALAVAAWRETFQ
jgi:uncharacterized protein YjbI with pentapeptide repeats